jgi:hypothetical protein
MKRNRTIYRGAGIHRGTHSRRDERRRCEQCRRPALVPPRPGSRMRGGWIFRPGHGFCQRCWRDVMNGQRRRARAAKAEGSRRRHGWQLQRLPHTDSRLRRDVSPMLPAPLRPGPTQPDPTVQL